MVEEKRTGGVTAEEIAAIATINELPPEAGASLDSRFCLDIAKLVSARMAAGDNGGFTVFLRSEALADDAARHPGTHVPMLRLANDCVVGGIWLTTVGLRSSHKLNLDIDTQGQFFAAVTTAGYGTLPTVVVDWRGPAPVGHLYRRGLTHDDDVYQVNFTDLPIGEGELKAAIDRFYEGSLRTPALTTEGHAKRIWGPETGDAAKGIPSPRPEETIQGRLLDVLKGCFPGRRWRAEPVTDDGRADIVGARHTSLDGRRASIIEWVLELKALTDMTSTGKGISASAAAGAIESALEQVLAYAVNLNAERAALCFFDLRKEHIEDSECFAEIADQAKDSNIPLWRWFLYRSTKASRAAKCYVKPSEG